jgi:ATP-dependent RNA helicase SUPV3L1/SUV3
MNSFSEQLKNLLQCDIKQQYPLARALNRKLYFFVGPTNSGKTYKALQHLKNSNCGLYLAPLRLLALEVFEELNKNNIITNLITGEEEILFDEATHISSTIEMINFDLEIDTAIIDEIQMIEDEHRGWAWTNALLGVPAKTVIMTGSVNALSAVKKIASYLNEELQIVKFKRKNQLFVLDSVTSLKKLQPKTALITFSRNDVLKLKNKLKKYKISVLYGNLSPEVRKEEAKKFKEGKTDILIATDAIAMGLNLPIKTLLFVTDTKFDGKIKRKIKPIEVAQIAGRAGRYGHYDSGYIGATKKYILLHIKAMLNSPIKTIKPPFMVKATMTQINQLSVLLNTTSLFKILTYYSKNMKFFGPFKAINIKELLLNAKFLDSFALTLEQKYIFAQAPISYSSPIILKAYKAYILAVMNNKQIQYKTTINLKKTPKNNTELLKVEDEVKKVTLFLWLSYKFPNNFINTNEARNYKNRLNQLCERGISNR